MQEVQEEHPEEPQEEREVDEVVVHLDVVHLEEEVETVDVDEEPRTLHVEEAVINHIKFICLCYPNVCRSL